MVPADGLLLENNTEIVFYRGKLVTKNIGLCCTMGSVISKGEGEKHVFFVLPTIITTGLKSAILLRYHGRDMCRTKCSIKFTSEWYNKWIQY